MTRYTVRPVRPGRPSFVWSVVAFVVIVGARADLNRTKRTNERLREEWDRLRRRS